MKKIKENIEVIFIILIGVVAFLLVLPFTILMFPFAYSKRKKFEKKYAEFLIQNNNLNFFCYNNRKNMKAFIETEIIPNLSDEIEIVFLNGKNIENENYPTAFLSNAIYHLNNYSKFPHLMKIRNGKLIDKSINTLFYSIKNQNKPKQKLFDELNDFFEHS